VARIRSGRGRRPPDRGRAPATGAVVLGPVGRWVLTSGPVGQRGGLWLPIGRWPLAAPVRSISMSPRRGAATAVTAIGAVPLVRMLGAVRTFQRHGHHDRFAGLPGVGSDGGVPGGVDAWIAVWSISVWLQVGGLVRLAVVDECPVRRWGCSRRRIGRVWGSGFVQGLLGGGVGE
jgi:hypothetical protein